MPVALGPVWTEYQLMRAEVLDRMTRQELDAKPARWVSDLQLLIGVVQEVQEAKAKPASGGMGGG